MANLGYVTLTEINEWKTLDELFSDATIATGKTYTIGVEGIARIAEKSSIPENEGFLLSNTMFDVTKENNLNIYIKAVSGPVSFNLHEKN